MSAKSAIIKFGYTDHKVFVAENGKLKHTARCIFCTAKKTTITENLGVTSGFTRHMKSKMHESKYEEYLTCWKSPTPNHQLMYQPNLDTYTASSSSSSPSSSPLALAAEALAAASQPSATTGPHPPGGPHPTGPHPSLQMAAAGTSKIKTEFDPLFTAQQCSSSTKSNDERTLPQSRQETIEKAIVKYLIVGCSLPVSVVESTGFRKFMKIMEPTYTPMAPSTLTSITLPYHFAAGKDQIKTILRTHSSICLTVDVWSDGATRSFMGVTAHIPCNNSDPNFNLQSLLLSFQSFTGTQTGETICNAFEDLLSEYDIKNKIDFILYDDASRMKASFFVSFPCDQKVADEAEDDVAFIDVDGGVDDETIWEDLDEEDSDLVGYTFERNCKKLLPCFAHTLQLVIGEGMAEITGVATAIAKARLMASLFHHNVAFKERFENNFGARSIPSANLTTGWNSTFHQLKAILSFNHNTLVEEVCGTEYSNVAFSEHEWSQLGELVEILEPFSEATELTQGEQITTISLVVPTVLDLNTHLRNIEDQVSYFKPLVNTLQGALVKHFQGIFVATGMTSRDKTLADSNTNVLPFGVPFADKIYLVSSVLDPYFELHWVDLDVYVMDTDEQSLTSTREDLKKTIQELVAAEALDIEDALVKKEREDAEEDPYSDWPRDAEGNWYENYTPPPPKVSRLEAKYISFRRRHRKDEHGETPTTKAQLEVKKYLEQIQDTRESKGGALKFWEYNKRRYPILYPLAKRVLGIPASSALVERVFSRGGVVQMGPPRKHPSRQMISTLMFLKCNERLLL